MKRITFQACILGCLTTLVLAGQGLAQVSTPPSPLAPALQNPIEVQPRGPIHEGFAQPSVTQQGPTPIVPKAPPPNVPEVPPEQRPDNAQWIPGYWSWDAERQDYIWTSGVYRVAPQGRTFVPGHWIQAEGGYRWVAGFWTGQDPQNLPITPAPPASLENGPSAPPPDDTASYIPGNWAYNGSSFAWQPGYYANVQPGRVWNPASYIWTPNGYVYNNGYWDYPLDGRGQMYAPVAFNQPLWQDPNWAYQPNYPLGIAALLNSGYLFGNRYYYGNYGGSNYARAGYRPANSGRGRYDPIYAHSNWQNQRNRSGGGNIVTPGRSQVITYPSAVRTAPSQQQVQRVNQAPIRVAPQAARTYVPQASQRPVNHTYVPHVPQASQRPVNHASAPHVVHAAPARPAPVNHAPVHRAPVNHAPANHAHAAPAHHSGHRH